MTGYEKALKRDMIKVGNGEILIESLGDHYYYTISDDTNRKVTFKSNEIRDIIAVLNDWVN